jgi:hypothetical protein
MWGLICLLPCIANSTPRTSMSQLASYQSNIRPTSSAAHGLQISPHPSLPSSSSIHFHRICALSTPLFAHVPNAPSSTSRSCGLHPAHLSLTNITHSIFSPSGLSHHAMIFLPHSGAYHAVSPLRLQSKTSQPIAAIASLGRSLPRDWHAGPLAYASWPM